MAWHIFTSKHGTALQTHTLMILTTPALNASLLIAFFVEIILFARFVTPLVILLLIKQPVYASLVLWMAVLIVQLRILLHRPVKFVTCATRQITIVWSEPHARGAWLPKTTSLIQPQCNVSYVHWLTAYFVLASPNVWLVTIITPMDSMRGLELANIATTLWILS